MDKAQIVTAEEIQNRIYTFRGVQVMLDNDIADFYGVETKALNQAVKRNIDRFPLEFMFQLTQVELDDCKSQIVTLSNDYSLRSQIVTLESKRGKHRKYLPFAFTEQGVAMLSAVLKSDTAVKVSVQIINAFVAMRRFIATNAQVFHRLDAVERKQIEHKIETDQKFEQIFNAIEEQSLKPKQGIFFDGQVFDAYQFVSDLIRSAEKSILLIDNYIDDTVLTHFAKRKKNVAFVVLTKTISRQLELDAKKFNAQYQSVVLKEFNNAHDRFIIIDETTVYHFGASLKDLGKKWFAFSKMDIGAAQMLETLNKMKL